MSLNSVNTNIGASVALQSLELTNTQLQATQKAISTGYKVADATDDGAAFAVAQKIRSDVGSLGTVNQQLTNTNSLVSTTLTALTDVSNTLTTARQQLVNLASGTTVGDTRSQDAAQYTSLIANIKTFFQDASYLGKTLVGNIGGTAGFGNVSVIRNEVGATYGIATFGGSAVVGSINAATLTTATGATAAITAGGVFTKIIDQIGTQLNYYGSVSTHLNNQVSYNSDKIDSLNNGLGSLVDADLTKESAQLQSLQIRQQLGTQALSLVDADLTKESAQLQSLQIRQQLGTQALSLANNAPQSLLSLFK